MTNRDTIDELPEAIVDETYPDERLPRDDPINQLLDKRDSVDDDSGDEYEPKPRKTGTKRKYVRRAHKHDSALGPLTRKTIDRVTADTISDISDHLQSGLRARISRIRPTWCSGWLEDQQIESSEISPLLEYLAAEYGGQSYRITLLGLNGKALYDGQLQIAGPPKSRGKPIDRDQWEGIHASTKPAQVVQPQVDTNSIAMIELMKSVMDAERAAAKSQLASVRDFIESTKADNATLLKALIAQKNTETQQSDITTQITNFANVSKALSKLRDTITPLPSEPVREPFEKSQLEKLSDVAMQSFVSNFMQSKFGNNGQAKTTQTKPGIQPIPDAILDGYDPDGTPPDTTV